MIRFENYRLTDADAEIIHGLIADRLSATKNWTLSAVEDGDLAKAQDLARKARDLQDLYATFNVKVRRDLEAHRAK